MHARILPSEHTCKTQSKCDLKTSVLKNLFESFQQKNMDKTIFDQQDVDFVWKNVCALPIYGL